MPGKDEAQRLYRKLQDNPSQLLAAAQARFVETGDAGEVEWFWGADEAAPVPATAL
ncbi:MAG TPA: hypothetical protein VK539_30820 [Myxococcaceae bacterium]|nr:hypothetical protein [Myxococcaceae bacterium]